MADAAPRRNQQRRRDQTVLMAEPVFDEVERRVRHGCQTSAPMLLGDQLMESDQRSAQKRGFRDVWATAMTTQWSVVFRKIS